MDVNLLLGGLVFGTCHFLLEKHTCQPAAPLLSSLFNVGKR